VSTSTRFKCRLYLTEERKRIGHSAWHKKEKNCTRDADKVGFVNVARIGGFANRENRASVGMNCDCKCYLPEPFRVAFKANSGHSIAPLGGSTRWLEDGIAMERFLSRLSTCRWEIRRIFVENRSNSQGYLF
jgi:hypothetical protein